MPRRISPTKEKILSLLLAGLALGLTRNPFRQWKIIGNIPREFKKIDGKVLRQEIKELYKTQLVSQKQNSDGSLTFELTRKGKLRALTFHFETMKIKQKDWDKKWRLVIFDIPEKLRNGRDALRKKLRELGFRELQKSAFVIPDACEDEIEFIIEFFDLRPFVRFAILETIDNEVHLKQYFKLV